MGHRRTPPIPPVGKTLIPNIKDNIIHFHLITFNLRYHNFSIIGIYLIKKGRRKKRKNHKGKSMKSWNKSKKKKQKEITNEEVTDRKNDCRHKVEHQYNVMVLFIMLRRLQMITHLNPVQLEYTIHTYTRVSPSKEGTWGNPPVPEKLACPPTILPKISPTCQTLMGNPVYTTGLVRLHVQCQSDALEHSKSLKPGHFVLYKGKKH